jgi:hypothetical protein
VGGRDSFVSSSNLGPRFEPMPLEYKAEMWTHLIMMFSCFHIIKSDVECEELHLHS